MSRINLVSSTLIMCYLAFFDVNLYALGFSPTLTGQITNFLFGIAVIANFNDLKHVFSNKFKWINISTIILCSVMVYSSYKNQNHLSDFYSIRYTHVVEPRHILWRVLKIFYCVYFMELVVRYKKVPEFLRIVRTYLLFYCCVTTVVVLLGINRDMWGGKFSICYIDVYLVIVHCLLTGLKTAKDKRQLILLLFMTTLVSLLTKCSTIIVALLLIYTFLFSKNVVLSKILLKPLTMVVYLIFCSVILFYFSTWALSFEIVQQFILDVLNEDLTLTGRLVIYEKIQEVFTNDIWFGLGPGNYSMVVFFLTNCENAQNGLINLFLEIGILGVVAFIIWLYLMFRLSCRNINAFPLVVFIYAWITISAVEIPFSYMSFYVMAALFILFHTSPNNNILR